MTQEVCHAFILNSIGKPKLETFLLGINLRDCFMDGETKVD